MYTTYPFHIWIDVSQRFFSKPDTQDIQDIEIAKHAYKLPGTNVTLLEMFHEDHEVIIFHCYSKCMMYACVK